MRSILLCGLCAFAAPLAAAQSTSQSLPAPDLAGVIAPAIQGVPKIFLPDFGIAADVAYQRSSLTKKDPRYDNGSIDEPQLRDGQLVAFSPIDPYTNAQFTIDLPNGGAANIEEAWLYFDKLPGDVNVRLGRFLPQFGLLDLTNTFQLAMLNRPSAIGDYIGSDGMDVSGAEANFYIPNPWELNLKADLNAVAGDALGGAAQKGALAYLATLDYSGDFLTTGSIEAGASAAQGPSPYGLAETLVNPYFQIQYAPSQRRVWTWSVEGMLAERQGMGGANFKKSVYTFLDYNFALRYHAGFLVDVADLPGPLSAVSYPGAFPDAFAGAPSYGTQVNLAPDFTWFVSDNTRLRLQYTHTTPVGSERPNETASFQVTFSLGNLKQLD
ncbi:MAG TPA: hypothetical protein VNH15_04685 [Elusimicrobiota bacterium]|nr:hypothetical protein [Elusimicrobiota bacterium]